MLVPLQKFLAKRGGNIPPIYKSDIACNDSDSEQVIDHNIERELAVDSLEDRRLDNDMPIICDTNNAVGLPPVFLEQLPSEDSTEYHKRCCNHRDYLRALRYWFDNGRQGGKPVEGGYTYPIKSNGWLYYPMFKVQILDSSNELSKNINNLYEVK